MTYFDPKVYNWKELKGDDRRYILGYSHCMEDVATAISNLSDTHTALIGSKTLDTIIEEIKTNFGEDIKDWLENRRVEVTCSIMDSNEEYWEK